MPFCSMSCYYKTMAASKVPLSVDLLDRAERHVDSETVTRLRQISAESFAKKINQQGVVGGQQVLKLRSHYQLRINRKCSDSLPRRSAPIGIARFILYLASDTFRLRFANEILASIFTGGGDK